ncbi:hypothetical protein JN25_19680 [Bacillus sp. BSC154]|nr:hypothetical protein JN25_19680 [Bacillus sp. BSC154]
MFEYGSFGIKWDAVKLQRELFYCRSVRCSCVCRSFLTVIEVYSRSLLVNASLMKSNKKDTNGKEPSWKMLFFTSKIQQALKKLAFRKEVRCYFP